MKSLSEGSNISKRLRIRDHRVRMVARRDFSPEMKDGGFHMVGNEDLEEGIRFGNYEISNELGEE